MLSEPSRRPVPRAVTLSDVAAAAGVSVSTASNALAGTRPVGAATVERVLAAASALGYRRNEAARSLRTGRRMAIGVVVPDVTNPFFASLVRTVEVFANELDWSVTLCNTLFDDARETAYLRRLAASADGVLLFSTKPDPDVVRPIVEQGVPLVACDERIDVDGVGGVYSDNADGGRQAALHLAGAGGRRFAILEGPDRLPSASERRAGFLRGLAEAGVHERDIAVVHAPYSLDGGRDGIRRILREHPEVDAVFASTDLQAIGALFEAESAGVSVPDHLLIAGFDGIEWTAHTTPSLTTVRQDVAVMAERAFAMLAALIAGDAVPTVEVLPVELVARQSTRRTVA